MNDRGEQVMMLSHSKQNRQNCYKKIKIMSIIEPIQIATVSTTIIEFTAKTSINYIALNCTYCLL